MMFYLVTIALVWIAPMVIPVTVTIVHATKNSKQRIAARSATAGAVRPAFKPAFAPALAVPARPDRRLLVRRPDGCARRKSVGQRGHDSAEFRDRLAVGSRLVRGPGDDHRGLA
jgi:hypothetical protein